MVIDEAGNPVEGAKIIIQYLQYTYKLEAVSNKKGQWSIFGLGKGEVNINVEKEGFLPTNFQISVSGVSKNPVLKIVLKKPGSGTPIGEEAEGLKASLENANKLYDAGQYLEAITAYQSILNSDPRLFMIRLNIGNCYMEMKEYDKAIAEYQKLLEEMNNQPEDKRDVRIISQVYAAIGDAYLRQDKFDQAQEYFLRSINIDQTDPAISFNVAEIMMNAGKTDEAIKYYEISLKADPKRAKTYLKLGLAWLNKGDIKKAIEYINKVKEVASPDDPDLITANEILKKLSEIK
ncbi:MAG: tetratricopeptide repeat protein [Candidatus Aminicenantes bacterium]|nr:tetratricopeptide repeat protein [Candidatus Aminicenantes bacterium]